MMWGYLDAILTTNRKYVTNFWPLDPSPAPETLEKMHKRILEKEIENDNEKSTPKTNGTKGPLAAA